MVSAILHDGSELPLMVRGQGPHWLLPVNPTPIEGPRADEMRQWGADPALGKKLIAGLEDLVTVVAFDYEGHVMASPKPDTLTADNVAADFLAVADAIGADCFGFYGYSWLAAAGLQLAIRTDRLAGLAMGGFPPLGGPYAEMRAVTAAAHAAATDPRPKSASEVEPGDWSNAEMTLTEAQTRQFVTLYESIRSFDDRVALRQVICPRLCFAGSEDVIDYDERWGGVRVDMASPLREHRLELEQAGWTVQILDGLDHLGAMQASIVIAVLRPWIEATIAD
ncbi:MAG TPA: alpha/beta hydrolase [Acidimicrobiia bacterium]|jgi:pimeloyl-ACP methyl ester carboxylesterase